SSVGRTPPMRLWPAPSTSSSRSRRPRSSSDSRGFYTSRVIGTYIAEAVAAVGEGVEPATVEQAALQAGYPTGALQLLDELTLTLSQKIRQETKTATEAAGGT